MRLPRLLFFLCLFSNFKPLGLAGEVANLSPEAVKKAIQALLSLKAGDEEGFDLQADILLRAGAKILSELDAGIKALGGDKAKAFPLQRVRDMLAWPLNVRGQYICRVYNERYAQVSTLKPGMIVRSIE